MPNPAAIAFGVSLVIHACLHRVEPLLPRVQLSGMFAVAIVLLGAKPLAAPFEIGALALWLSALTAGSIRWHSDLPTACLVERRAWFVLLPVWAVPYFTLMDWNQRWQDFPLPSLLGSTAGLLAYAIFNAVPKTTKVK